MQTTLSSRDNNSLPNDKLDTTTDKSSQDKKKHELGGANHDVGAQTKSNTPKSKKGVQSPIHQNGGEISADEFIVERIIGKKIQHGKVKYQVKWDGYDTDEATWEPIENLESAALAIEKYEKLLQGKDKKTKSKVTAKDSLPTLVKLILIRWF